MTQSDLESLERIPDEVRWTPPDGKEKRYVYCCFSRSGFTGDLVDIAEDRGYVELFDIADVIESLTGR